MLEVGALAVVAGITVKTTSECASEVSGRQNDTEKGF